MPHNTATLQKGANECIVNMDKFVRWNVTTFKNSEDMETLEGLSYSHSNMSIHLRLLCMTCKPRTLRLETISRGCPSKLRRSKGRRAIRKHMCISLHFFEFNFIKLLSAHVSALAIWVSPFFGRD